MKLSEALVLAKTKVEGVDQVRNLNLWGNGLTDVELVRRMPLLEMLSLSVNKIGSLRHFSSCANLVELHLRKNEVTDLREVRHLVGLKNLKVLWLCDNPCAETPDYRARVIQLLPGERTNNEEVSAEERKAAAAAAAMGGGAGEWTVANPAVDRGGGVGGGAPAGAGVGEGWRLPSPNGSAKTSHMAPPPLPPPPSSSSSNVLYAVMALLSELDEESLRIVHREVEQRLGSPRS